MFSCRWAFNHPAPNFLKYKEVEFSNQHGSALCPYRFKSPTHPKGWTAILVSGLTTIMSFVNAEHITNMSYTGIIYDLAVRIYLSILQISVFWLCDEFKDFAGY